MLEALPKGGTCMSLGAISSMQRSLPLHGLQSCHGDGAYVTQWSYEPCHTGPPKTDKSWWSVLTKRSPLEEGMANHSNIFAVRIQWTVWKGKKIWHQKMTPPPGQKVSNTLLGKSRGFTNSSRKNKVTGPKWNDAQMWKCLVVKVKSDAVKNNIAYEPGMLGLWIKVNWTWSSKRWQGRTLTS